MILNFTWRRIGNDPRWDFGDSGGKAWWEEQMIFGDGQNGVYWMDLPTWRARGKPEVVAVTIEIPPKET